jgi:holo-[acyl-carrier protein] synthase
MYPELGIDCIEISRFDEKILANRKFLEKFFTDLEINYCFQNANPSQHFAVRYAGKESIIKAMSQLGVKINFDNIEIFNDENGRPFVRLLDQQFKSYIIKISLSHTNSLAIACSNIYPINDESNKN